MNVSQLEIFLDSMDYIMANTIPEFLEETRVEIVRAGGFVRVHLEDSGFDFIWFDWRQKISVHLSRY